MSAASVHRRTDAILVAAFARAVYDGRTLRGHVHAADHGWLAEGADGSLLGTFPTQQTAVRAVLDAGRRA